MYLEDFFSSINCHAIDQYIYWYRKYNRLPFMCTLTRSMFSFCDILHTIISFFAHTQTLSHIQFHLFHAIESRSSQWDTWKMKNGTLFIGFTFSIRVYFHSSCLCCGFFSTDSILIQWWLQWWLWCGNGIFFFFHLCNLTSFRTQFHIPLTFHLFLSANTTSIVASIDHKRSHTFRFHSFLFRNHRHCCTRERVRSFDNGQRVWRMIVLL